MVSDAAALHTLRSVEAKPGFRLAVVWDRGTQSTIDFTDTIKRGGVFASLERESLFKAVRVSANRRKIEWPEPRDSFGEPLIDIDAESLLVMARQQNNASLFHRLMGVTRSLEKAVGKGLAGATPPAKSSAE